MTRRHRAETTPDNGPYEPVERSETWKPSETAVIVCDVWDAHHCLNATRRVKEMAPRMNQVLRAARDRGALIIHAPSSCTDFYADHPARKRAQVAPRAANLPADIGNWCNWIDDREQSQGYPIDHSDGGEDDDPEEHSQWSAELTEMGRNPGSPWIRQIDLLKIDPDRDAISDSGVEIWNLLEQHRIRNVILLGVHTNMCVLGRPFGLRQMAKNGKHVVLMRDMTDTMYNPARRPYVSHFRGTDLVVQHAERFVCPTITSDQLIGGQPFRFAGDRRPHVVIAISEPEYETDVTLPRFARQCWEQRHGYIVTVLQGDPQQHRIPGFAEALRRADVLVLSIRRQALPPEDLAALRAFLQAGKPLIGIRTSCHAFDARGKGPAGHEEWLDFDPVVLGGNYHGHHGHGPTTTVTRGDETDHPLLRGMATTFRSQGSLYKVSPLASSTQVLLMGEIPDQPTEPVAWVNHFGPGSAKIFFTSLGYKGDFDDPSFCRLLDNALSWGMGQPIPLTLNDFRHDWQSVCVPRSWERVLTTDALAQYDGFGWYRYQVKVPAAWKGGDFQLQVGKIGQCDQTFVNGDQIGATGSMPPAAVVAQPDAQRVYNVPASRIRPGRWNTISVRVFDKQGRGGIYEGPLSLSHGDDSISLAGTWQFRVGDDPAWAEPLPGPPPRPSDADGARIRTKTSEHDLAQQILDAAQLRGGLVVHLGCGDGRLTAALRAGESYLVHGLDRDARHVQVSSTLPTKRRWPPFEPHPSGDWWPATLLTECSSGSSRSRRGFRTSSTGAKHLVSCNANW